MSVEQLRKVTIKTCGFDIATIKETVKGKGKVALIRLAGIVNSGKPGQTDKGEFLKLFGEFQAINLVTGEQFSGAQCILPNFISDQFAAVLASNGSAEFALEIGAKENEASVTGYEFTVTPLMESKGSNRMQELIGIAMKNAPALPAPSAKKAPAKKAAK